jgi:replication factor A1
MKIDEIKSYQKKISITAKVMKKTNIRQVKSRLDNQPHNVCEALVADDSGSIYITLWDKTIDQIKVGKTYIFKNLFSSEFKRSLRLNVGRFGVFEEIDEEIETNTDNFKS